MDAFRLPMSDGVELQVYRWLPAEAPRATVQIAHGMGEHAARYDRLAGALTDAGYAVYADDHRGHGRTATEETLGLLPADGWNRVIRDAYELHGHIGEAHPGLPRILIGHSMGAMLCQQFVYRYGSELTALALSGSPGFAGRFSLWFAHSIARFERWRHGADSESALLQKLVFGKANDPFDGPEATGFEWLTRDRAEMQRYVDDPLCGFVLRAGGFCDLYAGAREARQPRHHADIPSKLPIYLFSGSDDPVHGGGKNLDRLVKAYRKVNSRVTERRYPGGRHELLNETNRDEVTADLLAWLDEALPARP